MHRAPVRAQRRRARCGDDRGHRQRSPWCIGPPVRVIGIDPGTVSVDVCGLDDGRVFLDRSFPTADALGDPSLLVGLLESAAPLDLVAGPSGYGLPLVAARDLTE